MTVTYPIGTPINEIVNFDRSEKVFFACTEHMDIHYCSKDPFSSSWFPANKQANDIEFGLVSDPCTHTFKNHAGWVTVAAYTS